jgi:hypothetical protein
MSFEKKLKRVSQRDWAAIKDLWVGYSGHLNGSGQPPPSLADEILSRLIEPKNLPLEGERRFETPLLRDALLSEAVFGLHRAAHVLGACEVHVDAGILTWSISNAYHSAFLALDSVLKFLGICIVTVDNVQMVVDVWPEPPSGLSNSQRRRYGLGSDTNIVRHDRLDHYHRWHVLQRAINTLKSPPVSRELVNLLCSFGSKSFARQRNELHYLGRWYFDDLFAATPTGTFCTADNVDAVIAGLSEESQEFSYFLAAALVYFAQQLLAGIAQKSPAAELELHRMQASLSGALHPLMKQAVVDAAWKAA